MSSGPAPGEPDVSRPHASMWNVANLLTALRLVMVPVIIWLLLREGDWRKLAFVLFLLASVTDLADGELARRRGLVTDFGKIADPIADKALTGGALISLSALSLLSWWVTAVILVREIGITVLRFWVIRQGVIAASRGGKIKTVLQVVAIALYILPLDGLWVPTRAAVMYAAVAITVITGADYVLRAIRMRSDPEH